MHENVAGRWLKKNMPEFYNNRCKKREVKYLNEQSYYKKPNYCLRCGKVMTFKKRFRTFCCGSCSSTYNNNLRYNENKERISRSEGSNAIQEVHP